MKRIINIFICIIVSVTAILGSYESTYAHINDNVSETYIDEDRNLVTIFQGGFIIRGTTDKVVTTDMSKADRVKVSFSFYRKPCCANAEVQPSGNIINVYVNDIWSSFTDTLNISEKDPTSTEITSMIDVNNKRTSNGKIKVVVTCNNSYCKY